MRLICVFLVLFNLVYPNDFVLNPNFKCTSKNPQSKNIIKHYESFINKIKNYNFTKKLYSVNDYLNSLNAKFDGKSKKEDYWSSRGEFLCNGGGDCEDYTIAKYYTLKELGIKNQCLLIVRELYTGSYHMVLAVWKNPNKPPLILDNLSSKILPLTKRIDLKSRLCIDEQGYYKIINNKKVKKQIRHKSYEKMLKRQQKEKFWIQSVK